MARIARVVVPGFAHHVTQRGTRGQETFFCDEDYEAYLELMAESCSQYGVEVWAYCLMPNHVHLIVVPDSADGLRRGIGEAHRRYTRRVNFRRRWRGHLWQGRLGRGAFGFVPGSPAGLKPGLDVQLILWYKGDGRNRPDRGGGSQSYRRWRIRRISGHDSFSSNSR